MMKRKIVSLLSLLVLTFMVFQTAEAYVLDPYKWQKSSNSTLYIAVKWGDRIDTPGSIIRNAFEAALTDWHDKQTHIRYNVSSSTSNNILNSYYLASDTEYGYANVNYYTSTGYINYFSAFVNAGNPDITTTNVAQSVAAHELGHSYGLGHSTSIAVMNQNRVRTTIYTAQTDDVNGVNARYK